MKEKSGALRPFDELKIGYFLLKTDGQSAPLPRLVAMGNWVINLRSNTQVVKMGKIKSAKNCEKMQKSTKKCKKSVKNCKKMKKNAKKCKKMRKSALFCASEYFWETPLRKWLNLLYYPGMGRCLLRIADSICRNVGVQRECPSRAQEPWKTRARSRKWEVRSKEIKVKRRKREYIEAINGFLLIIEIDELNFNFRAKPSFKEEQKGE